VDIKDLIKKGCPSCGSTEAFTVSQSTPITHVSAGGCRSYAAHNGRKDTTITCSDCGYDNFESSYDRSLDGRPEAVKQAIENGGTRWLLRFDD